MSRSASPENDVFAVSIVQDREHRVAATRQADFDGLLSTPLLLHEDLQNGCGGQLWPAGMSLAKYMLRYHHDLSSKSVVELGAGGGLVGLAVASGCLTSNDWRLVITDQLAMLSLMQKNIGLNALGAKVEAAIYDWGNGVPSSVKTMTKMGGSAHPDVVLAADCVYFEPAFPLLLKTLGDLVGPNTTCYFCFKKRRKADMRFIRDLKKTFQVVDIDYEWREDDRHNSIFLYAVTARNVNR